MSEHLQLKDHHRELRIYRYRLVVAMVFVFLLVGALLARFFNLQVVEFRKHVTASDQNRIHYRSVAPTRGLIFDRNGELLAENRPSYTLALVKERVSGLDSTLAEIQQLIDLSDEEIARFKKEVRRRRPYEHIPLRYRLSEEEIATLAVNEHRLPGIKIVGQLMRHYPQRELYVHSVGYVGRINDRELATLDVDAYKGTDTIGKTGIEKYYEKTLLGEVGNEQVETNARGRVLRLLERQDPTPGKNLTLSIDSRLQTLATEALAGRRGSVVLLDVKTGEVLAFVSTPAYDPNLFVTGISHKDYQALVTDHDLPLFNRSLQGRYPPGSTIKPMMGLAALSKPVIGPNYRVYDPGWYQLENDERYYRDWKKGGHGHRVGLIQAIAESCDTFFYDVAFKMGIDYIHKFGSQFELGRRTGIDMPGENRALWPSREWKRKHRGLPWFPGDTVNVGIGQGDVLTTPLQLAVMTAILANKGKGFLPRVVKRIGEEEVAPVALPEIEASEEAWQYIHRGMYAVAHGARGTARMSALRAKYHMAGKTGTAQVVGIAQGEEYDAEALAERQRDHALYVGFAPYEDPQVAVAVIVENGEHGSTAAAPIARQMFDLYLGYKPYRRTVTAPASGAVE